MKAIYVITFLACLCIIPPASYAVNLMGAFAGASLELDIQIESPAINNRVTSISPPKAGDVIRIQLFVPQAANQRTLGYNIELHLVGKSFFEYFSAPTGRTWDGVELLPVTGKPVVTALLISLPTVPSNGFLGTVEIRVIKPLDQGAILAVKTAAIADPSADNDLLNVSAAAITFTNAIKPIAGDLNLDGTVDFADFLIFASNFGKTGPVPTLTASEPQIVFIRDTVVVRDTFRVVVRDTIYRTSTSPPPASSVSNTGAVSSLDLVGVGSGVAGNGIDNKVVSGNVSGRGTRIVVEVFASGVTTGLAGVNAIFAIDARLLKIASVTAPSVFPLVLSAKDSIATVGAFAPRVPPNGHLMTVTFETVTDVTGLRFSIGLRELNLSVSPTDFRILTTGQILFNETGTTQTPVLRAEKLLGFWRFDFFLLTQWTDQYHLQRLSQEKSSIGEIFVEGVSSFGTPVLAAYMSDDQYLLAEPGAILNTAFVFKIVGDRAVGVALLWNPNQNISDAREYQLIPPSGRTSGFASVKPIGVRDKMEEINQTTHHNLTISDEMVSKIEEFMNVHVPNR